MARLSKLASIDQARYSRRQDLDFAIRNRRNRLITLWVAERMHLGATAAAAYASDVVGEAIVKPEDEALIARLVGDLTLAGLSAEAGGLRDELHRLGDVAAMEFGIVTPERPCAA